MSTALFFISKHMSIFRYLVIWFDKKIVSEFHCVYRQSAHAVLICVNVTMVLMMSKTTTSQICKTFLSMLCPLTAQHMMTSSNGNNFRVTGPVDSPHKGQWREALIFQLICVWTDGWANNGDAGGLIHKRAYYDVTVMTSITRSCRVFVGPLVAKILPYVICIRERVNIEWMKAFKGINDKSRWTTVWHYNSVKIIRKNM